MAGADATETGNEFSQLKFVFTGLVMRDSDTSKGGVLCVLALAVRYAKLPNFLQRKRSPF